MKIHFDTLKGLCNHVFVSLGVPPKDSEIISDVIAKADLYGFKTHGVSRLAYYIRRIKDGLQHTFTPFEVLRSKGGTAIVDGGNGMGQIVAYKSMSMAITKARKYGVGCVTAKNSSHFGICSYYSLMAANAGMIGVVFTNARPAVAPFGGKQPVLGTNPYSIAMPSLSHPFVIDCATSVIQRGHVEEWCRSGAKVPKGVSIPQVESPETLLAMLGNGNAALTVMAEHKGYGLSVAIEMFCAALSNGAYLSDLKGHYEGFNRKPYSLGHFFLAIDPEYFIGIDLFRKKISDIRDELKQSGESVLVAGDLEFEGIEERKSDIEIDNHVYSELQNIAAEFEFYLEKEL
tara:strand:+ start:249 stop:1283 length:1035 start_codon:yes stop_codon:yes gene_type:complete